jgi:CBS-domain-containing membrane protein
VYLPVNAIYLGTGTARPSGFTRAAAARSLARVVHTHRIVTLFGLSVSYRSVSPVRSQRDVRGHEPAPASRRRGGVWGELALAVPPTIVVLVVILAIENITRQRLLFASLASSAFLIYYAPLDHMNGVRVMVLAQGIGCCAGVVAALLLGGGYAAAALAMVVTILVLITLDLVHPPGISTAIGFAFITPKDRTLLLFVAALALLGVLVVLQRIAVWILHRIEQRLAP